MTRILKLLSAASLAGALSCRAPEEAHGPSTTASCPSSEPAAATYSDLDGVLGTRLRSAEEAEELPSRSVTESKLQEERRDELMKKVEREHLRAGETDLVDDDFVRRGTR